MLVVELSANWAWVDWPRIELHSVVMDGGTVRHCETPKSIDGDDDCDEDGNSVGVHCDNVSVAHICTRART